MKTMILTLAIATSVFANPVQTNDLSNEVTEIIKQKITDLDNHCRDYADKEGFLEGESKNKYESFIAECVYNNLKWKYDI